jgi:hypothetical protein
VSSALRTNYHPTAIFLEREVCIDLVTHLYHKSPASGLSSILEKHSFSPACGLMVWVCNFVLDWPGKRIEGKTIALSNSPIMCLICRNDEIIVGIRI